MEDFQEVGKSNCKYNNMKKFIIINVGVGFVVLAVALTPLVEGTPQVHTMEPSFPTQPVPSLVMPFSGSYTPATFCNHTGSWS